MGLNRLIGLANLLSLLYFTEIHSAHNKNLININEENWRDILAGEWMIAFKAPWCPACIDLGKAWDSFADVSEDLNANVAEIDVTISPGLSGRFLVTALPTIYHVKDGVFRQYLGSRDKDDFISFIEEKKWRSVNPVPSWKHPDTVQMTIVSYFFKLSMAVRDLHNYMVEKQGIPSWGSYAIFGLTTLVLGCILGFVIVYLIDCIFPSSFGGDATASAAPTPSEKPKTRKKQQKTKNKNKDKKSDAESSESEQNVPKLSLSEGEHSGNDETTRQRKKKVNGTKRD